MENRLLPDDIISLILKHANQYNLRDYYHYSLINKQFNKAANARLWESLYLLDEKYLDRFLPSIINNSPRHLGHHVRLIRLRNVHMDDSTFLSLMTHVPFLKTLEIREVDGVTDASFQHVPQHIPHLTSLSLNLDHITHLSIQALGQHCHQLCHLYLGNFSLSPYTFSALAGCPLIRLSFFASNLIEMDDQDRAASTALDLISFPHLKQLMIRDNSMPLFSQALTAAARPMMWPQLTHLMLMGDALDDTCAIALMKHLPDTLQTINLNESNLLTDRTLDAMIALLPDVKNVDLDDCKQLTHHGVRRLARGCARLWNIYVGGCRMESTLCFPDLVHLDDCCCYVDDDDSIMYVSMLGRHSLDAIRHRGSGLEEPTNK